MQPGLVALTLIRNHSALPSTRHAAASPLDPPRLGGVLGGSKAIEWCRQCRNRRGCFALPCQGVSLKGFRAGEGYRPEQVVFVAALTALVTSSTHFCDERSHCRIYVKLPERCTRYNHYSTFVCPPPCDNGTTVCTHTVYTGCDWCALSMTLFQLPTCPSSGFQVAPANVIVPACASATNWRVLNSR